MPRKRGPGKIYDTPADKERARNARRKLVLDAARPAPVVKPERPALVAVMRIVPATKPDPVARPTPACRRAKPKAAKVPKVFKSTVGQILCRVSYPSKYKGLVDRCEIWVNAADVEAKRVKYLELGGTFHTAHVIIIQPVELVAPLVINE